MQHAKAVRSWGPPHNKQNLKTFETVGSHSKPIKRYGGISTTISIVFFADVGQMQLPSWSQSYWARVPQAFERFDHDPCIPMRARIHGKSRKPHTTAIRPALQQDGHRHNEHQMGRRFAILKCLFDIGKQHAILWRHVEENPVGHHVNHGWKGVVTRGFDAWSR